MTRRAKETAQALVGGASHPLRFYVARPTRPYDVLGRNPALDDVELNARVRVRRIQDPSHPCDGQFGLFAARTLRRGQKIGEYGGLVLTVKRDEATGRFRMPKDVDTTYFADLGSDDESATFVDGKTFGNEMSFANDFRGTKWFGPNAEIRRDDEGGLPVVALKRIPIGREILFDYGEGYWRAPERRRLMPLPEYDNETSPA